MHGLLLIIELRGPKVILRDMPNATSSRGEVNVVESLYWLISGVGDGTRLASICFYLTRAIQIMYPLFDF
jgi:hypothetical protein